MNIPVWHYVLSMLTYFIFLLFMIEFMKNHYKFSAIFWVAALCTFPIWLMGGINGWFRWAKTFSAILPLAIGGFFRLADQEQYQGKFWDFMRKDWIVWFVYLVLFLNIAEATLKDVSLGNYANALCGLLLCVTIPFPNGRKFFKLSAEDKSMFIAYTTVAWNFLYTTWNLCFVYGETGKYFASSICILMAAEVYPIIKRKPELYISARIYTLSAHVLIRACFPNLFPAVMDASTWMNADVLYVWGIVNAILIIPYVFWYIWQLHTGKAEQSFSRGKIKAEQSFSTGKIRSV